MNSNLFVTCPHCGGLVHILQVNCTIFRHGQFKQTGQQINPHTPKVECERLVNNGLIYGCGRPFKYTGQGLATVCDYL